MGRIALPRRKAPPPGAMEGKMPCPPIGRPPWSRYFESAYNRPGGQLLGTVYAGERCARSVGAGAHRRHRELRAAAGGSQHAAVLSGGCGWRHLRCHALAAGHGEQRPVRSPVGGLPRGRPACAGDPAPRPWASVSSLSAMSGSATSPRFIRAIPKPRSRLPSRRWCGCNGCRAATFRPTPPVASTTNSASSPNGSWASSSAWHRMRRSTPQNGS